MKLSVKSILYVSITLIGAVLILSLTNIFLQRGILLRQIQSDGNALAELLAKSIIFTLQIPEEVDEILGDQMVVQARIAAHLVGYY